MYSYLKGEITEIKATHVTIECCGIGYLVKVPNPYQFIINSPITLYLSQQVREDAITLYGFSEAVERDTFLNLINVKGLGPKGALAILASTTRAEIITALKEGNPQFFAKFPGIGPKLSQQIILDLRGKLEFKDDSNQTSSDQRLDGVASALKSLGYSTTEIKNITKNLQLPEYASLSDAVKIALKSVNKR